MARTKDTTKKKRLSVFMDPSGVDKKIAAVEEEIESLSRQLKDKKNQLKSLTKEKDILAAQEAERKAEEDKQRLYDAVMASGKSIEDILASLT